jgi:uncharacterized protein
LEDLNSLSEEQFASLEGPERYPFLQLGWLRALETSQAVLGTSGWIPRHLVVYREGKLVAFVPGYIKLHSFGEFVFDQGWAQCSERQLGVPYYPKFVVGVPFTPTTGPRFLLHTCLTQEERKELLMALGSGILELCEQLQLSSAHILFCDEQLPSLLAESGWVERLGIQYQFHNSGFSDFDQFLGQFRAKRRANIRRERREVKARGYSIEVRTGSQLVEADAQLAYQLYLTTVDKYAWGKRYLNEEFFRIVFNEMPQLIHLVTAKDAAGQVVAGAVNLLGKDAIYGRYWGSFVSEPFLHFEVCLYAGIEDTIARGLSRFEAGAGGEHKHGRGLSPTLTRSIHYIFNPRLSGLVTDFCQREAVQLRRMIEAESAGTQCESEPSSPA